LHLKGYKNINLKKNTPQRVQILENLLNSYPKGYNMNLSEFVKAKRKLVKLTQPELAAKAGVGLRFIRELEQGKETLRLDKVNQVLQLFGFEVGAVPKTNKSDF
jgi:y4mF family transcriptional regulator